MIHRILVGLCLAATLGACSTVEQFSERAEGLPTDIAGYPTVLSPQHQVQPMDPALLRLEQDYLAEPVPLALAVSVDGDYGGYWRCTNPANCQIDVASVARKVINWCEGRVLGGRCVLHSLGTRRINPLTRTVDFAPIPFHPIEGRPLAGPAQADGLLVYLPGFWGWADEANDRPRADNADGFPLLDALDQRGWDVVRVNIPYLRRMEFYEDPDHWRALLDGFRDRARAEGYARVSFLGYSRGGAELLGAIRAGGRYDGAAVVEPDRRGPKFRASGKLGISDQDRLEDVASLAPPATGSTPLFYVHFAKSRWFGAMNAAAVERAVRTSSKVTVLSRPNGFASHYAGGSPVFARRYAACVDAVLRGRDPGDLCADVPADPTDWSIGPHLEAAGLPRIGGGDLKGRLSEGVFCRPSPDDPSIVSVRTCLTVMEDRLAIGPYAGAMEPMLQLSDVDWDARGACAHWYDSVDAPRCYDVYWEGEGFWLVDRKTGHIFGRHLPHPDGILPAADWLCRSFRGKHGEPECKPLSEASTS